MIYLSIMWEEGEGESKGGELRRADEGGREGRRGRKGKTTGREKKTGAKRRGLRVTEVHGEV